MIRTVLIGLMLSSSALVGLSVDAHSQTTEQTDRSEDDWRKSKKRRGTSDIFEGITNTRKDGQGWGSGPMAPIDSLPAESRRHLMKERAKAIAMSDPGQAISAPYTPSQDAQSDSDLAAQEKEAWDDLIEDMNDGAGQSDAGENSAQNQTSPSQTSGGSGPSSSPQGQSGQGQSGQRQSDGQSSNGPLRGGSSESVSDILAQIKGLKSGSGKTSDSTGGGDSSSAEMSKSEGDSKGGAPQGEASKSVSSNQNDGAGTKTQADGQSRGEQSGQQGQSNQAAQAQTDPATTPEPISPLDYIRNQRNRQSGGQKSSASDFLKKKQD